MDLTETISAAPLVAKPSVRRDQVRGLTSCKAGLVVPLAYIPVLREDRVQSGELGIRVEMAETVRPLMNGVSVSVQTHFVPFLAFDRFSGMDQLNRAYMGIPETEGGAVTPFFDTMPFDPDLPIFKTLGLHAPDGSQINASVVEAYNTLVNWRRKARSSKLPQRLRLDTTLASGFWRNSAMREIVPDFDQAMIDGEVTLQLAGQAPVSGIGFYPNAPIQTRTGVRQTDGSLYTGPGAQTTGDPAAFVLASENGFPAVYAELAQQGVQLSLSNIELAKQTAAFAALRKRYDGLDDDWLVDLLMMGVRVPDAQMSQPMLLDRQSSIVGLATRYATDAGNLDQSVTVGETLIRQRFRLPPMNTGGIILVTCEIVPEQLYERQQDHFLTATSVSDLPQFTRDFLDPEKVAIVPNSHVDVLHSDPDGTFGYAPLNYEWERNIPRIGGKFHRQINDPFIEDRQRIWSVETVDPQLTADFYLASSIHHKVFADNLADPFEITTLGGATIVGSTVFGKRLEEDTGDYDKLMAQIDQGRINQEEDQ